MAAREGGVSVAPGPKAGRREEVHLLGVQKEAGAGGRERERHREAPGRSGLPQSEQPALGPLGGPAQDGSPRPGCFGLAKEEESGRRSEFSPPGGLKEDYVENTGVAEGRG